MQHSQGVSQQHEACFVVFPPFYPTGVRGPGQTPRPERKMAAAMGQPCGRGGGGEGFHSGGVTSGHFLVGGRQSRGSEQGRAAGEGGGGREAPGRGGSRAKVGTSRDFAPAIVRPRGGWLDPSTAGVRGGPRVCVEVPCRTLHRSGRVPPGCGEAGTTILPRGGRAPLAGPERWKWRELAPAGYWGARTVPFPAEGWVCFWRSPALSAGEKAARGGLRRVRDAAEPGVLGDPGGSPVDMPLVPL